VTIISVPQAFNEDDLYVDLRSIFGQPLFLKCEGFNFAGSIKLKAAAEMVAGAERDGRLTPKSVLVESSSGNLGVALSMIAASKGYRFLCVTDSRCNLPTRPLMEALGSQVHVITEPDAKSGFLGARLNYLRELCASDDRYVWLDKGFAELVGRGLAERRPRLVGVQAEACQPPGRTWLGAPAGPAELDPAATVADGIAVVRPAIGDAVLEAVGRGGGGMVAVSDDLLGAVATLARRAGVGAEPAGAAALAGLEPAVERGLAARSETVVLLVTGREVKVGGAPSDLGRVAVVDTVDQVERALAGDP
jgi:threonine synthase